MLLSDFNYSLPDELIAQEPSPERGGSRLMVLERNGGRRRHLGFRDLAGLLAPDDLLVLNDTRVIPARLVGRRADEGTSARVEVLLVERLDNSGTTAGRAPEQCHVPKHEPATRGKVQSLREGPRQLAVRLS